jgi:hypothetical protein
MATKSLVEVLLWLEDLFERHGIERSYGGALARNFYAPPRFTRDIDLLVLMSQVKIPGLVEDLRTAGTRRIRTDESTGEEERVPLDLKGFLDDLRSQPRLVRLDCFGVPVELFAPWHPFDHEVLRSALRRDVGSHIVRVHRPEHLLVYKKVFDRSKDIEDVKAILVANAGKLDLGEIRKWAGELLDDRGLEELEQLMKDFYR